MRFRAEVHGARRGRDGRPALRREGDGRERAAARDSRRQMRGRRAAAAAQNARPGAGERLHLLRERLRSGLVDGAPADDARQPRVGLRDDGRRRAVQERANPRFGPVGAEPAVDPQRVHAQAFERGDDGRRIRAREQLAALVERDGREHGQPAPALLGGDHGRLELAQVGHRLNDDQVRPGRDAGGDRLAERRHGVLEAEVAERREEPAGGADVERDEALAAAGLLPGAAGVGDRGGDELGARMRRPLGRELHGRRAEGVREHVVRARLEVGAVHGDDVARMGKVPLLGHLARRQAPLLQERAHAAVGEDKARFDQVENAHRCSSCAGQACPGLAQPTPTNALTLLVGTIRLPAVSDTPRRRAASTAARKAGWIESGTSP